ncbi:hypothetical protein ACSHWB_26765 [Lentzea sp. HUAS TT2]
MSTGTWRWQAAAGGGLAAALVLVVLGWWRGPVSLRRKAWITGVGAALR